MAHRALKPLFASKYEKAADAVLQRIAQGGGDRLNVQTSVSQLVDVDDPELLAVADKRFMLEATFDFVFTRDDEPIFVVEIDGARHARDVATIRRDIKKDAICAVLSLPILRMSTALAIMQDGKRTILEYVADTYYLAEAFYEAQQSGTIPWDEPFFAVASLSSFRMARRDGVLNLRQLLTLPSVKNLD